MDVPVKNHPLSSNELLQSPISTVDRERMKIYTVNGSIPFLGDKAVCHRPEIGETSGAFLPIVPIVSENANSEARVADGSSLRPVVAIRGGRIRPKNNEKFESRAVRQQILDSVPRYLVIKAQVGKLGQRGDMGANPCLSGMDGVENVEVGDRGKCTVA